MASDTTFSSACYSAAWMLPDTILVLAANLMQQVAEDLVTGPEMSTAPITTMPRWLTASRPARLFMMPRRMERIPCDGHRKTRSSPKVVTDRDLKVDTICVHGDTTEALDYRTRVQANLKATVCVLAHLGRPSRSPA
jgi:UPF0271 protein